MERNRSSDPRLFRSKTTILDLLKAHEESGLSIQAFCVEQNIATGNFRRWKKRYSQEDIAGQSVVAGFSNLQIEQPTATALFAEVKGIKQRTGPSGNARGCVYLHQSHPHPSEAAGL